MMTTPGSTRSTTCATGNTGAGTAFGLGLALAAPVAADVSAAGGEPLISAPAAKGRC